MEIIIRRLERRRNRRLPDECELYGVTLKEVRPYTVELEAEPLTIDYDNRTITLNLTKDDNGYPLSVAVDYQLSDYARIATQNGGRDRWYSIRRKR